MAIGSFFFFFSASIHPLGLENYQGVCASSFLELGLVSLSSRTLYTLMVVGHGLPKAWAPAAMALSFLSLMAGSSRSSTLSLSLTPTMCRWSKSSLSFPLNRSLCSLGSIPATIDTAIFSSPKVEVAPMDISWQVEPVDILTVIISQSPFPDSLFWTSIPPGRSSHSISTPETAAPSPAAPAPCTLELLLNSLFDLRLIIFIFSLSLFLSFSLLSLSCPKPPALTPTPTKRIPRSQSTSETRSLSIPAMTRSGPMAEPPAPAAAAATAAQAMKEWQRLARVIADGDGSFETYEDAARVLASLRHHRFSRGKSIAALRASSQPAVLAVPEHFLCPISSELMRDPVVVASGQTYDRHFIQEWLNSGNRTCPRTGQVLSNTILIPNALVGEMIAHWCIEHGITQPKLEEVEVEGLITREERNTLDKLLEKISNSSSISEQKEAMKNLRSLTKRNRSFRALIGEKPSAIDQLLSVLSVPGLNHDMELEENTVTTILNLSIHDSNKKIVGDNPQAIPILIKALKGATMETRANAAAALFTLSALDEIKVKIGQLGALKPLAELLESGSLAEKKDAGSAIFNLCMAHENRPRAAREGVVDVLLKTINSHSLVDESLSVLALLSRDLEAIDKMAEAGGGVPCLMNIIRGNSSARNKENAVTVLFSICVSNRSKLREVGQEDGADSCISQLAENGTSRARRKATGILDRLRRTSHSPSYSC